MRSVYVMAANKKIKIGVSNDPLRRLYTIQASMPWPVTLEAIWDVPASKAFRVEKLAHHLLGHYRTRGEWFDSRLDEVCLYQDQLFDEAFGPYSFKGECRSDHPADRFAYSIFKQRRFMTMPELKEFQQMVRREAALAYMARTGGYSRE